MKTLFIGYVRFQICIKRINLFVLIERFGGEKRHSVCRAKKSIEIAILMTTKVIVHKFDSKKDDFVYLKFFLRILFMAQ